MKRILLFLCLSISILCLQNNMSAQVIDICAGDGTDSVTLSVSNFQYGLIQWQQSEDMEEWWDIYRAIDTTLLVLPEGPTYYRTKISYAGCPDAYSDTLFVQFIPQAYAGFDRVLNIGDRCRMRARLNSGERGMWTVLEGTNGVFGDEMDPHSSFVGTDTLYKLLWTVYNACGSASDTIEIRYVQTIIYDAIVVVDTTDVILSDSARMADGYYDIVFGYPIPDITDTTILVGFLDDAFLRKVVSFYYDRDTCHIYTEQATIDDILVYGVIGLPDYFEDDEQEVRGRALEIDHLPTRAEIGNGRFDNDHKCYMVRDDNVYGLHGNGLRDSHAGMFVSFGDLQLSSTMNFSGDIHLNRKDFENFDPVFAFCKLNSGEESSLLLGFESDFIAELELNNFGVSLAQEISIPLTSKKIELPFPGDKCPFKFSFQCVLTLGFSAQIQNLNGVLHHKGHLAVGLDSKKWWKRLNPLTSLLPDLNYDLVENSNTIFNNYVGSPYDGSVWLSIGPQVSFILGGKSVGYGQAKIQPTLDICRIENPKNAVQARSQLNAVLSGAITPSVILDDLLGFELGIDIGGDKTIPLNQVGMPMLMERNGDSQVLHYSQDNPSVTASVKVYNGKRHLQKSEKDGPSSNIPVYFESFNGGTVVSPIVMTDANGIATTEWYPNNNASGFDRLFAYVYDCDLQPISSPVSFIARNDNACDNFSLEPCCCDDPSNEGQYYAIFIPRGGSQLPILVDQAEPYMYLYHNNWYGTNTTIHLMENSILSETDAFMVPNLAPGDECIVTVQNLSGCLASSSISIAPAHVCEIDGPHIEVLICDDTVHISSSNAGNTLRYAIDNNNFTTQDVYYGLSVGEHWAKVRDAYGCVDSMLVLINEREPEPAPECVVVTLAGSPTSPTSVALIGMVKNLTNDTYSSGFCWSTTPNVTYTNGNTITLQNVVHSKNWVRITYDLNDLTPNQTYYFRAFARHDTEIVYGDEEVFTLADISGDGQPCPGTPTVTDIDGNHYHTVKIGNQCWMREDMRTSHFSDGQTISLGNFSDDQLPHYYYPNNDIDNVPIFGYLYNWKAISRDVLLHNVRSDIVDGVCPVGWHLPTASDYRTLLSYVGNHSHYQCNGDPTYVAKALASTIGWIECSDDCTPCNSPSENNVTGLGLLPTGGLSPTSDGTFFGKESSLFGYTKSINGDTLVLFDIFQNLPYVQFLSAPIEETAINNVDNAMALPVRCIRGESLDVTMHTIDHISATMAVCKGAVISDGGLAVTARGVCWSTSHNPTISDNHTSNGSGLGYFTSTVYGLNPETTYYLRAYATNEFGTVYGRESSFKTPNAIDGNPCSEAPTVTDYDGNIYNTVRIGTQCWTKENMRTLHYSNGTALSLGTNAYLSPGFCYYPNNELDNKAQYGMLYNWVAAMNGSASSSSVPSGVQGVCPVGWHVPSDAEWSILSSYLSTESAYQNIGKSLSYYAGWDTSAIDNAVGNMQSLNNATGFSAIPSGYYLRNYNNFGSASIFWTATDWDSFNAGYRSIFNNNNFLGTTNLYAGKDAGYSVRCLLDNPSSSTHSDVPIGTLPKVATSSTFSFDQNGAVGGGEVIFDGSSDVIARGVCWSTHQNPTILDNHSSAGMGSRIFSGHLTNLVPTVTYYVRAYATNAVGTAYGNTVVFVFPNINDGHSCQGTPFLYDYDGNQYNTVQIGNQCWMKENLRTEHYSDGTEIPLSENLSTLSCRYCPENAANVPTYGYKYNWYALMHSASSSNSVPSGVQGVCPVGWHIPSSDEWSVLINYVESQRQYRCNGNVSAISKSLSSTLGWHVSSNACAPGNIQNDNSTGFSALPAGGCHNNALGGTVRFFGDWAMFGSATATSSYYSNDFCISYNSDTPSQMRENPANGRSVRCLRD